ncbi:MAG: hypothetical protein IJ275_00320 [Ruminococcus sp.]|nr:hypothetical protein [Ruminococcus sp.]
MKKITAIILALTLVLSTCLVITGCSEEEAPQVDNSTHTLPPTEAVVIEPEWAEVDCDIALIDASTNTTIIYGDDFDTFAVYGSTDEDSYIAIKVTQEATDTVNSTQDLSNVQLVINGDTAGDIVIKPGSFTGEIAFGHDFPYENLCILASSIRGLY